MESSDKSLLRKLTKLNYFRVEHGALSSNFRSYRVTTKHGQQSTSKISFYYQALIGRTFSKMKSNIDAIESYLNPRKETFISINIKFSTEISL